MALIVAGDPGEARSLNSAGAIAPTMSAQQAAAAAAQQAAGAAAQARTSLARATAAIAAMQKVQRDAAAAAQASSSSVPNGLGTGGLMPAGGTASDPLAGIKADLAKSTPTMWQGAALPTQTTSGPNVTVDITQIQPKAILNWNKFNVGANTTLNFHQSGSDWIALNRVLDPTLAPSQILGHVNAPGSVYVINRNGIIFGAGSQINVHSLIASTLDVGKLSYDQGGRDRYFIDTGIANINSFSIFDPVGGATTNLTGGAITVQPGASITTSVVGLDSPGFVYLFGANVTNAGSITVPAGEVALVAARAIDVVPHGYSVLPSSVLGKDTSGNPLTFRGTEFVISPFASSYAGPNNGAGIPLGYPTSHTYLPGTGVVTHEGLIEAPRGIVVMDGDKVSIDSLHADATDPASRIVTDAVGNPVRGVISVDTSIGRNSMVLLRAATSVDMNGVISSLPYDDGSTLASGGAAGSTVQAFLPAYIEMSAQGSVTLEPGALVSAPSAYVSLRAINLSSLNPAVFNSGTLFAQGAESSDYTNSMVQPGVTQQQVLLDPGATIDVAGLQNVELPATYNFISFQPRGGEFADMPLQRNGVLYGQTLWIDIRASGTRSDGTAWVGTPVADASGYVANVGRSIQQLMTTGGTVSMTTDLNTSTIGTPGVTLKAGSVINVAGGSVNFLPGTAPTTRLIGSDGRIYSMANADPNMTYVGIAGQFTVNHGRWGVTETWSSRLTQTDVLGYTEGHDAGGVIVTTVNPSLQGTMYFGSLAGERQVAAGQLPSQGSLTLTTPSSVQIGSAPSATLSADTLSSYALSALNVTANDLVLSGGSTLNLAPGGKFSVTAGGAIDIAGNISANDGTISLVTDRYGFTTNAGFSPFFKPPIDSSGKVIAANIYVEGTLDVSGRFVNDTGRLGADASGPGFINGGTISITTNKSSGDSHQDTTGSIKLAAGSLLDVSSGGYISPLGTPKTATAGVMAGKAGSISLLLYQGVDWSTPPDFSGGPPRPSSGSVAALQLDGKVRGYGFESNASLTLGSADTIRIGGTLQPGESSSIQINGQPSTLPASWLTGGGFGAYTLLSTPDGWTGASANITVSAGTSLNLRQQNLSSTIDYSSTATGTALGQQKQLQQLLVAPWPSDPSQPVDDRLKPVSVALMADNVLLDTGASIVTDPKAKITFGGTPKFSQGDQPATNVLLLGSITDHGGTVAVNALKTWLGPQAQVDLSGTFVANFGFGTPGGPATSGKVLAGGTFSVEAALLSSLNAGTLFVPSLSGSYVVAQSGAQVDVSGYARLIDVQTSIGARAAKSSVWSWSDAGTVSLDTGALLWGGSFMANGGVSPATGQSDPRANGGTIILGGGPIVLRQDSQPVIDALNKIAPPSAPGSLPTFSNSSLNLITAAIYRSSSSTGSAPNDVLAAFDNVYLYSGIAPGGAARIFTDLSGNIYGNGAPALGALTIIPDLTGSFTWNVANRLHIAASAINVGASAHANIALDAPYVLLTGGGAGATAGTSSLTVTGQTIDVEGAAFQGFSKVALESSGDIRLSTPKVVDGVPDPSNLGTTKDASRFAGQLIAFGDLLLSAQRIYPVSAVDFTIQTPGNVTFAAPVGSSTNIPLSAGGSLTVIANTIDQAGNLFAPLGKITLGNLDTSVSPILTSQVTLGGGSLTSVTLADTVVPYGATQNGTSWYYNASVNALTQPPSKGLVLAGTNVKRADGSTIDLRGGGDLQAMEWIQGQGGSRDTLTTTPLGQTVYALVPSSNDPVAAFDIHFTTARSATTSGDVNPLAGTQITIDGGNGIPAGTYTLYPAHYATLPGAMRVVYYGDYTGRNLPSGTTLPDGTVLVTGNYTQSTAPGKQSFGQSLFAVQTGAVWKQYSEYTFSGANTYFSQLAAKQGVTTPRLPMDAGRLSVLAQQSIILNGIALAQPGQDSSGNTGRGGELDISAPQLAVVGHTQYVDNDILAGYVGLDVTQINGFESVLIGGQRSDTGTGTLITPTASNVLVDTRGENFAAPEILLVAKAVGEWQTIPQSLTVSFTDPLTLQVTTKTVAVETKIFAPALNSGTVTIAGGSVITTTGEVHAGTGRNYYFADPSPNGTTTAQNVAAALGGTLDASGTVITGADLSKLDYFSKNADGSFVTNPDGSLYQHVGTISATGLAALQTYSYQTSQPQLGGLFVATNDTSLKVSGPTGIAPPSLTIQFGPSADPKVTGAASGSLLLPSDAGRVFIEPGASITTKALSLQATASVNAIVVISNDLHVDRLNLTARTIGLGPSSLVNDKSVVLYDYNPQFSNLQALSLKALSGTITVYGDFNPGAAVANLTLDAAALVRADSGGSANISVNAGAITLVNTGTATVANSSPPSINGFALSLNASDIVLGGATQAILGYNQVNWSASDRVFIAGAGAMTLGAGTDVVNLNVTTPNILVAGATATGAGSFAVTTLGNITVVDSAARSGPVARPVDSSEIGGNLALTAANIAIGSTIQAQAGTITLKATAGDVTLGPGAYIAAGGYKKALFDVDTYVAGGKVVLQADAGNITTALGSVIDVAQPTGGQGYGGEIDLTALGGGASLAGALLGSGGPGLGGRFKLDIKGVADLTALADNLLNGGITGSIDIHTRTGNLDLSQGHTLRANAITLTADDTTWPDATNRFAPKNGQIIIEGTVDANGYAGTTADGSGQAGGQVGLFGHNAVVLTSTGQILARTGGSDVTLVPGTAFTLPSKILWFGAGTGTDSVTFSTSGRYTTDGGATYTSFAANTEITLSAHSAVVLDAPGSVAVGQGSAPVGFFASAHDDERGGDVMIGTAWSAAGNSDSTKNSTAGYIDLQAGSTIDVSGGIKGGLLGGTVSLRAPLDGNNDVKISHIDATISGARAVNVQGYLTIDTQASTNNQNGIDGSQLTTKNGTKVVWDGYIDPAGLVSSTGITPTWGPWTNVTGEQLKVTAGAGYTAPPNITVVTSTNSTIQGTSFIDPLSGATFYQVTDPVTGTTFRSSLQVAKINITSGGTYTSRPTVTITGANSAQLPSWGGGATATAVMAFNPITLSAATVTASGVSGGHVVRLLDASGTQIGTAFVTFTQGQGITFSVTSATNPNGNMPATIRINLDNNGHFVDVTTGFTASLSVAAVNVIGGAGYSGPVSVAFSSGNATATATMGAAVTVTGVTKGYAAAANLPKLTISGTGTGASATFAAQTAGFSGTTDQTGLFAPSIASNFIPLATSEVFKGTGDAAVLTIAPNQQHQLLYSDVLANFVEGNGIQGVGLTGSFGFTGLFDRLQSPNGLVTQLGANVVHVQPGIDLVNTKDSATTNSGNITVVSNWNLAAGTAGNLQTAKNAAGQSFQYFDPTSSYVNFNYRLATPWGGLDAGALTLRAAGNININASISDGFFQFGNYLDPNYVSWVASYLNSNFRTMDQKGLYTYYLNNYSNGVVPIAPYNANANTVSPAAQDLAAADLFPNTLSVCTFDCSAKNIKTVTDLGSWSYGFTAGADISSANPRAMISLATALQGDKGNGIGSVIVDKHTTYTQSLKIDQNQNPNANNATVNLPTMVRTGTGSISVAAALDLKLADTVAPGVIYAAGVNTAKLAGPNYSLQTVNGVSSVVASNPDGFFEPQVLTYGNGATNVAGGSGLYYGPPTAAAFPQQGGDVAIDAQRDVVGYSGSGNKTVQYYQPWLLSDTGLTPVNSAAAGAAVNLLGAGVFTPFGTNIASQTAWWIQYGSFQQGILSAGGNVSVTAGRDLVDVSVSLPTTGRVSGGLSAASTPVTHFYGSGNMLVRAGRNILGGSFYEGSGHSSIMAGGSIGQNGTISRFATSKLQLPDVPLLAVDTGQIAMVAGGSIMMAGVVNPAELQTQNASYANPLDPGGSSPQFPLYMDTYGPDSKVRLVATTGDLTITVAPTAITDGSNGSVYAAAAMYPASFEALALKGSLITTGIAQITQTKGVNGVLIPMPGIMLSPSDHGTFELLAQGNVDLTFGYPQNTPLIGAAPRPFISAGPALIDTAFDPFQPNSGFDGALSSPVLAHQNDAADQFDTTARIYAASGDILATGSYGQRTTNDVKNSVYLQRIEINRPAKVYAGRDIVDLNLIVQNIQPSDVSTVNAGRNITYTGWNNAGGLQVAGPGFFVVQAGGDIGPFLPAAHDLAAQASVQEGIASVGNASAAPVGDIYLSNTGGSVGLYDQALYGPTSNPRRNALLTATAGTTQGADVVVLFGAKYGADYQAVIDTYINPDPSPNVPKVDHNYINELRAFLARVGKPSSAADATAVFAAFKALPADLQQVFVDQVFFAELKTVAISQQAGTVQYQPGYRMINTMFPSSLGYTANALGGGANGANQLVATGDLNLLHATIQTRLGGDISIFGPGGSILVGPLATEPNSNLKLRDLGILSLGGGAINTFTDSSVLVNSSRVLTTQGGDILMWSSNGDLDAGRGSKTTISQPPLQVQYDANDYQSVDLGGFVSGAGIGTLQTSSAAEASNLYLLAPRGKIDAGSAGIRVSGNLVLVATAVVNGGNIQVQGTSSGIPVVSAPPIGALTSGSNTAGATANSSDKPTASGNRDQASIFIVEVIGYGGGDGQSQPPPPADAGQQSDDTKSNKRKK